MGKNKNKSEYFAAMKDLQAEQARIQKKLKQIEIPCSHTKSNGKLTVEFIGKHDLCKCKRCGAKFSFATISSETLNDAIKTCYNAINQIKVFSNDPDEEARVIRSLGELSYNLKEIPELYDRVVGKDGKKDKKNKNKKRDDYGANYGYGSIGFIGGDKKKKKKSF